LFFDKKIARKTHGKQRIIKSIY